MLRRVTLVITHGSQERIASNIRMTRIGELGTTLAVISIHDYEGASFIRNVGSYKRNMA
jgi:hypothetical protein